MELRNRVKPAQDVFKICQRCESPNLIICENEVICPYCGWDSIAVRSEAAYKRSKITANKDDEFPFLDSAYEASSRASYPLKRSY